MTQDSAEPTLAIRARAGSADAFGRLVQMHQQAWRAFLRRLCGNAADADDLVRRLAEELDMEADRSEFIQRCRMPRRDA